MGILNPDFIKKSDIITIQGLGSKVIKPQIVLPLVSLRLNLQDKEKLFGKSVVELVGKINAHCHTAHLEAKYKTIFCKTNLGLTTAYFNFVEGCPCFVPLEQKHPFIMHKLNECGFLEVDAFPFEILDGFLMEVSKDK